MKVNGVCHKSQANFSKEKLIELEVRCMSLCVLRPSDSSDLSLIFGFLIKVSEKYLLTLLLGQGIRTCSRDIS